MISMTLYYPYSISGAVATVRTLPGTDGAGGICVPLLSPSTVPSPAITSHWLKPTRSQKQGNFDDIVHAGWPPGGQSM